MKILDLGCWEKKYKGQPNDEVIGLDIQKTDDVNVVWDLEKTPLPFDDNSFDMVYMRHTLEHIQNKIAIIKDINRILKVGGILEIIVPHFTNSLAYHVEHYSLWSSSSFECILGSENLIKGFVTKSKKIKIASPFSFLEPFVNRFPNFYDWRLSAFIPAVEIRFELRCEK